MFGGHELHAWNGSECCRCCSSPSFDVNTSSSILIADVGILDPNSLMYRASEANASYHANRLQMSNVNRFEDFKESFKV